MLMIQHVSKCYQQKGWFRIKERIQAVKDVTLTLRQGVCLAIVGESGSGKTTLGKLVLGIEQPDCGAILFDNLNVCTTVKASKKLLQKNIQVVFQDCQSAVNPKMKNKGHYCGTNGTSPITIEGRTSKENRTVTCTSWISPKRCR
ncbi:hypothetical protein LSPH24S_00303 [Lysinibacillus sphaericus]